MSGFHQSVNHLQMDYLRLARSKCLHFVEKLKGNSINIFLNSNIYI